MMISKCDFYYYYSIYSIHDEVKDKEFELELSWICEESGWQHLPVPSVIPTKCNDFNLIKALVDEASKAAKAALDADMEEDQ
jgi:20S proteasome subunit alpha 7